MKLVLSSAAIIIAASSGVAAADGHRRLRHGVTSKDEEYVAHRGRGRHGYYRNHFNPGPGQHVHVHDRTIHGPTCIGNCGPHSGGHHSGGHHYENSRQVEDDYDHWKNAHQPHSVHVNHKTYDAYQHWCHVHNNCDEDKAGLLADFFDQYDEEDVKLIADFIRSDAYADYAESEDYN